MNKLQMKFGNGKKTKLRLNYLRMKAKTKFEKMYDELPERARTELVYNFAVKPMTLQVCSTEISMNTKLGDKILKDLGFEDD